MRIYLVRHGESEGNVDRTISLTKPDHALNLTERGHVQAKIAGHALQSHIQDYPQGPAYGHRKPRLWLSPYARTRQTAKGLLEGGLEVSDQREHIGLVEHQFGLFDGIPDEELPKHYPKEHAHYKKCEDFEGRFWARMPLGESRFDVALRVHQTFGTFKRDEEHHKDIVVVTHGVVIRAFIMQWCHKPWEWFEAEPNPGNCSIRFIDGKEDCGYIHRGQPPAIESKTETV